MTGWLKNSFSGFVSLCIAALIVAALSLPAFDRYHGYDVDILHYLRNKFESRAQTSTRSPVAVIAIDELTYATQPFAGLPKVMWTPQIARIQNSILAAGAKVIGWDIILPTSAATYVTDKNFDRELLKSFAQARRDSRLVLGTAQLGNSKIIPHRLFSWAAGGANNLRSLNVNIDEDGIIRSVPTFLSVRKRDNSVSRVPSLALELAARHRDVVPERLPDGRVRFGDLDLSGSRSDKLQLNYLGENALIPTFSLADLYLCAEAEKSDFFREHFRDRVVLLGLVLDIEDRKLSSNRWITNGGPPHSEPRCTDKVGTHDSNIDRETTPGVYVHATAVNNILLNSGLEQPGAWQRLMMTLPLALIVLIATQFFRPGTAALTFLVASAGWIAFAMWQIDNHFVMPVLDPVFAASLTFVTVLGYRFAVVDKDRRFLKRAFSSYVSPDLVDSLLADPEKLKLGGERRELSFLFTDLADFTRMVENMEPTKVAPLLNSYLDQMIGIAKANSGTIDKVIGDAVVVIFSAPVDLSDHAVNAVNCAREMDKFAQQYSGSQRDRGIMFGQTRIGVHSGTAVVGNFGSSNFFDYTALGDAMNTAARLESVNKQIGTRVLVSKQALDKSNSEGRPVGSLVLKGKSDALEVFEIGASEEEGRVSAEIYKTLYKSIEVKDVSAHATIKQLCADYPNDPLLKFHKDRLDAGETGTLIHLTEK
ncbi:MAG: CHASE2 domain-containing protein [Methyloligellaceae bacterium]